MFIPGRNLWRFHPTSLDGTGNGSDNGGIPSDRIGSDVAGLADPIERCIYMNLYEI